MELSDNSPKAFSIREQQMDKVSESSQLPFPRLRPDGVLGVGAAGDHPQASRAQELEEKILDVRRRTDAG